MLPFPVSLSPFDDILPKVEELFADIPDPADMCLVEISPLELAPLVMVVIMAVHGIVTGILIDLEFSEMVTSDAIALFMEHSLPVGTGTVKVSAVVYVGVD